MALCLGNAPIIAQPDSFTITGCTNSGANMDGTYTRSATDLEGCPCYERITDNRAIGYYSIANEWAYSINPCATFAAVLAVYGYTDCDITTATTSACDPATTLTVAGGADVPTLSQWGLIVLALLLMTAGTLYLLQPKFRGGFEQKR
ncbi:MAG: IPTL-CTERM sorting domain-containing protein [Chitinophagales bacterium]